MIGDPGVGPYFRLGTLVWVPSFDLEPGVGPYFLMRTQVWVPNSWDGSHCKVIVKNYSILEIIESLEYSDLVKQIFYHSRGSHSLDIPLIDLMAEYHFSNPDQLTAF